MKILIKYQLVFWGILVGATAGYLYYHFVGCMSGSCAITSSPVNSTLYGALVGAVGLNAFRKENPKKEN